MSIQVAKFEAIVDCISFLIFTDYGIVFTPQLVLAYDLLRVRPVYDITDSHLFVIKQMLSMLPWNCSRLIGKMSATLLFLNCDIMCDLLLNIPALQHRIIFPKRMTLFKKCFEWLVNVVSNGKVAPRQHRGYVRQHTKR